ncbi:MAG: succinate dehydrogenase, hydrophobic membrane anchor protein, partial [Proteobacteria bacterium]|nr:succinate dehydrogenase, hydrophobic membrane anchor protein [Pseudomonadota bacterium]
MGPGRHDGSALMVSYRTPLGRARGLGSAKHGALHWVSERVSSIALVPLVVWMVYGVIRLAAGDYGFAVEWVRDPLNATLCVLTFAVAFWHMSSGMRVIVE